MMENRSVDHYLGWYGAEVAARGGRRDASTRTQPASYVDRRSELADRRPAGPRPSLWGAGGRNNYHGRGFEDPSHNINGGRAQANVTPHRAGREAPVHDGRLADRQQRHRRVRAVVLRPGGHPGVGRPRAQLRHLRPLLLLVPRQHPAEPLVPGVGPDRRRGLQHAPARAGPAVSRSGRSATTGRRSTRCSTPPASAGRATTATCRTTLFWGPRHVHSTRHISEYYAAAATGSLPQVVFIEPWFSRARAARQRRPPPRRHPPRPGVPPRRRRRRGSSHPSSATAPCSSPTTSGAGSGTTFRRRCCPTARTTRRGSATSRRRSTTDDNFVNGFGQLGMRVPTAVLSPWHTGGVDRPRHLRPRVDPQVHRRELRAAGRARSTRARIDATQSIEASFDFSRPKNLDVEVQPYDAPDEARADAGTCPRPIDDNPLFALRDMGWSDTLGPARRLPAGGLVPLEPSSAGASVALTTLPIPPSSGR